MTLTRRQCAAIAEVLRCADRGNFHHDDGADSVVSRLSRVVPTLRELLAEHGFAMETTLDQLSRTGVKFGPEEGVNA